MLTSHGLMENSRRYMENSGGAGRLGLLVVLWIRYPGYSRNSEKIPMLVTVASPHGILSISTRWLSLMRLRVILSVMDSPNTRSRMGSSTVSSISARRISFSAYHSILPHTHSSSTSSRISSGLRLEDSSIHSEMYISMRIISSRWRSRCLVLRIHFHVSRSILHWSLSMISTSIISSSSDTRQKLRSKRRWRW